MEQDKPAAPVAAAGRSRADTDEFVVHPALDLIVRWMCDLIHTFEADDRVRHHVLRAEREYAPWWEHKAHVEWHAARLRNVRKDVVALPMLHSDDEPAAADEPEDTYFVPRWFLGEHVVSFFLRVAPLCQRIDEYIEQAVAAAPDAAPAGGIAPSAVEFAPFCWTPATGSGKLTGLLIPVLWGAPSGNRIQQHLRYAHAVADIIAQSRKGAGVLLSAAEGACDKLLSSFLAASHPEIFGCMVVGSPRAARWIRDSVSPRYSEYLHLAFAQAITFFACVDENILLLLLRLLVRGSDGLWKHLAPNAAECPNPRPLFWLLVACALDNRAPRLAFALELWGARLAAEAKKLREGDLAATWPALPSPKAGPRAGELRRTESHNSFFALMAAAAAPSVVLSGAGADDSDDGPPVATIIREPPPAVSLEYPNGTVRREFAWVAYTAATARAGDCCAALREVGGGGMWRALSGTKRLLSDVDTDLPRQSLDALLWEEAPDTV